MLFSTSLVALVGQDSMRRLQIVNTKRMSIICELNFVTGILAVKLNRKRLVVVLEENIHIYDISNMKLVYTIDTCSNPLGLCALTPNQVGLLAYPANTSTGQVLIFDTNSLQSVNIIQAHKSQISSLSFNSDGNMLATASDKGTVIRIFSVPDAKRLYQLRRGATPSKINYISFNLQSNMVCVCSDTSTIHVFKLFTAVSTFPSNNSSAALAAGNLLSGYLPEFVSEMWEPVRDFAHVRLEKSVPCIAALAPSLPIVMVSTADGYFLQYSINLDSGGECILTKQYSLLSDSFQSSSFTTPNVTSSVDTPSPSSHTEPLNVSTASNINNDGAS